MAKAAKSIKPDGDKAAKPSLMSAIVPVLLLTLIAGGGGFAVGTLSGGKHVADANVSAAKSPDTKAVAGEGKPADATAEGDPSASNGIIRQLAPIVTNLASPKDTWMRIEVALVLNPEARSEQDMIAVQSSDKILGLLRTTDLAQIEGPSGFLHLREDLNDLLHSAFDSKVQQVLISSMVVE